MGTRYDLLTEWRHATKASAATVNTLTQSADGNHNNFQALLSVAKTARPECEKAFRRSARFLNRRAGGLYTALIVSLSLK